METPHEFIEQRTTYAQRIFPIRAHRTGASAAGRIRDPRLPAGQAGFRGGDNPYETGSKKDKLDLRYWAQTKSKNASAVIFIPAEEVMRSENRVSESFVAAAHVAEGLGVRLVVFGAERGVIAPIEREFRNVIITSSSFHEAGRRWGSGGKLRKVLASMNPAKIRELRDAARRFKVMPFLAHAYFLDAVFFASSRQEQGVFFIRDSELGAFTAGSELLHSLEGYRRELVVRTAA